jgi:hypothetical protein
MGVPRVLSGLFSSRCKSKDKKLKIKVKGRSRNETERRTKKPWSLPGSY